jgi:hypothetical protein
LLRAVALEEEGMEPPELEEGLQEQTVQISIQALVEQEERKLRVESQVF